MSTDHAANRTGPELKGIRGWLLVLVAYLLLYEPLRAIPVLLALWLSPTSAAVQNVLLIGAIVQTAIAVFSLFAGINLLRLRHGAVSIAKTYFVVMLTLGVLELGMVILGAVVSSSDPTIASMVRGPAVFTAVIQVLISGAWLVYLEQSKRVRATFAAG
jgi:hypothetical protein